MSNFVVIVDSDVERRTSFIEAIKPDLPPIDGLVTSSCSLGNFSAVWSAGAQAPVSYVSDAEGAAVLWGDAINAESDRLDAARLRNLWNDPVHRSKAVFDGFYAGVVYHPDFGLIAGADLLGIFPVYYYAKGDVLLMGSSPELFSRHPVFQKKFNPVGLVGILLTMHMFDGQTLLKDVRRLASGHLLSWQPGSTPTEALQYEVPVSNQYFSFPFSAHVDILDHAIDETIERHVQPDESYGLLLSGGLDSRMLAGYLKEKDIHPVALTLGKPTDQEMRCATPVARTMGFQHHTMDIGYEQYPFYANLLTKWEHIANGFNGIMGWGSYNLGKFAPRIIMGHSMDAVMGTNYINWAYSPTSNTMSFEALFAKVNAWGISPDILRKLLRHEVFGDLVDEVIAGIKKVYEGYSDSESQRAWCFNLYNRQRFHVGSAAWQLSFGAWPVLPALDRRLLKTAGAMPAATIAERRAQIALVCKRFPHLAALPLDRNSYNTDPLRPRPHHQLIRYLRKRLTPLFHFSHRVLNKEERRYYYRLFDFNSPGWLAVRQQAEPYREQAMHLFNKEEFEKLLPGPDVPLNLRDGIIDASGLKSLLGFMLWSKDHL